MFEIDFFKRKKRANETRVTFKIKDKKQTDTRVTKERDKQTKAHKTQ